MAKYIKRPAPTDATQWFRNGDHPQDGDEKFQDGEFKGELFEGLIVRYYRKPSVDGQNICKNCSDTMHNHGWMDTLEGGHNVCPGDFIITGIKGERYPCKPDIFKAAYYTEHEYAQAMNDVAYNG